MKIHRLRLQHVKGVRDAEIKLPDTGVVVLEGPNETGKSTFLEALDRLLDPKAKAHSKAAAIVGLQPVGEDVGPFVEAELSIGPYRLIFSKRWLRQSATVLRVLQPVAEQHSGEAAQARMTAIVDECLDRPLFEALRFAQVGPSSQIQLVDSSVLTQALDSAAGADLHSDSGTDLLLAVEAEYTRYFTAVNGKPTGDLRAAMGACTKAQDAVAEAHRRLLEAEQLVQDRDEVVAQVEAAQKALPVLREAQARAGEEVTRGQRLRDDEQEASRASVDAAQHRRHAETDLAARQRLVREVAERTDRVLVQEAQCVERAGAAERAVEELRLTTSSLHSAKQACADGQAAADAAATKVTHMSAVSEVAMLQQRVESASLLQQRLSEAVGVLRAAVVSPRVLRDIEQSEQRLAVATAAMDGGATTVTVHALRPDLGVSRDGEQQKLELDDEPLEYQVVRATELTVHDSVRIEVRPHADVQRRADQADSLREDLGARLTAIGAAGVEHARAMAEDYRRADAEVAEVERLLSVALAGNVDLDELRGHLQARRTWLQQWTQDETNAANRTDLVGGHADESGWSPADLDRARHEALLAQRRLGPLRKARDTAEDAVVAARGVESEVTRAHDVITAERAEASAELRRLRNRVVEERERASDLDLEEALRQARDAEQAAKDGHQRLVEEIRRSGVDDAQDRLRQSNVEHSRVASRLESLTGQFHELKGRLEMTAGEGRQEEYDRAGQLLAEARRTLASVGRRARAARQLHLTLRRHRDSAHASYVAPYAREIERLGQAMYGSSFAVRVSSDLTITHRELNGVLVSFDQLSGGAKEQLGILARLAVAVLVDTDSAVPVVIDDALGYTDPDRLQRLGSVLGEASPGGQIVLLTCTPQRYEAIPGAQIRSIPA
ncbi:MAG: AAA family ATPase [Ornithinimicrobium sp.]